ncbi:MAG: cyclic nucleotide-binding domain-containing protein [Anaerolineaceae bacterium]|nr:cyclic nucleotide-binding domain-containing protein [Anaerolineaceae bacterium]
MNTILKTTYASGLINNLYEWQQPGELIYRLRGLGMGGAVLHIGAHPDDEDVGLISYLAHKYGVRIVYWSATRGENGQNRIGPDKQEALGIYRTWESLSAGVSDGGEALFGPFYDFGFSKSAEETLAKWGGRETVIREIVRAIRWVQPQIVIGRWTGRMSNGHGHHQAIGAVTQQAFEAAGDPDRFPELQEQGLVAWQPRKLYFSTGGDWQPGESNGTFGVVNPEYERDGFVRINTGELDPISNKTFQEEAWIGFNNHQTQAMGFAPNKGPFYYYYELAKSLIPIPRREEGLYDGLDNTLTGLADYPGEASLSLGEQLKAVQAKLKTAFSAYRPEDAMPAVGPLLETLSLLRQVRANLDGDDCLKRVEKQALALYLERKIKSFEEITAECIGLDLECLSKRARITPGEGFRISARLWNHRELPIENVEFSFLAPANWEIEPISLGLSGEQAASRENQYNFIVSKDAELTCPYWLSKPRDLYRYYWPENKAIGLPFDPPLVELVCKLTFGEHPITLSKPAIFREAFPGGYRELYLAVLPPISVLPNGDREFLQVRDSAQQLSLQVVARSNLENIRVAGTLKLEAPSGWQVEPAAVQMAPSDVAGSMTVRFMVTIPKDTLEGVYPLRYVVGYDGRDYSVVLNRVQMGAPGLPRPPDEATCVKEQIITTPALENVHFVNAKFVPGLKYAYIKGADEDILNALNRFDLDFHLITDTEMGYIDLEQFAAIVIGPNAYLVRDELRKNAPRLPKYVEQGGTLIVLYQGYGYQREDFVPYPFSYSQPHDRVTSADAPVAILEPDHYLFNQPNVISLVDFDGWVHDRGLYFFGQWDKRYKPFLACNDVNEEPKKGGLLLTSYGQGTFIYTGYSFHRQLPAGVPGAFRLFANLLAVPAALILERARILENAPLFAFMNEEQLQALGRIMSERWEDAGVYLCHQGDEGDEMYIIVQGEVEIIKESGEKPLMIYLAKKGEAIGEMQVLSRGPRSAAMRCKGDVHLLVIKGDHFRELMHRYPAMSDQVIQTLVHKLAAAGG